MGLVEIIYFKNTDDPSDEYPVALKLVKGDFNLFYNIIDSTIEYADTYGDLVNSWQQYIWVSLDEFDILKTTFETTDFILEKTDSAYFHESVAVVPEDLDGESS